MSTDNNELTNLSDEALAELAKNGDKPALDLIISKYTPLAGSAAKIYHLPGGDREDLVQEGLIGLYKAVMGFDISRQTQFYFFAKLCVERQVLTAVKSGLRGKHAPLNAYSSLSPTLRDETGSPEDIVVSREDRAALETVMRNRLSAFENRVLLLFIKGCGYAEIAERLCCTNKAVDNALHRVRKKLKPLRTLHQ